VHLVLQQWNMARWMRQPFNVEVYRSVFDAGWADQQLKINWDEDEQGQRQTAWTMLEKYFIETPIKSNELPEAVEVPVEADLSKHGLPVLRGVLDSYTILFNGLQACGLTGSARTASAFCCCPAMTALWKGEHTIKITGKNQGRNGQLFQPLYWLRVTNQGPEPSSQ
jgi:hypothetical protein